MGRPLFVQQLPPGRPPFQHEEAMIPLTIPRQTDMSMPMLGEEDALFTALFILDPHMIGEYLDKVIKHSNVYNLWVAGTSQEGLTDEDEDATIPPMHPTWKSTFVGKPVEDAFAHLATLPLDLSVNRVYLVVLDDILYREKGWIIIYNIDEKGVITCVPCTAHMTLTYINSYMWHNWHRYLEEWRKQGRPVF
ncbi:unnamed protein product [Aureobasidium mustum]|uniref:Uncharacterized protein n=1 Tax=Aureobasidium mustum TaxID=2773714 RepID=A0A9N8PJ75_9PEZI|nr:unnamed protein product [Aureobasidium mustum]